VRLGPGDDLAEVVASEESLLLGVDQVVDGLHVDAAAISWDLIGRKAVCRSLSDVAAMGGVPLASLAAVVLPEMADDASVEALCEGLRLTGLQFGAPLVGGDVAIHRTAAGPLTISVSVLGAVTPPGAVTRSEARPGDLLCVTGVLGGTLRADQTGHHLSFSPRLAEGQRLRASLGEHLHAMMDISDGLAVDGERMAVASAASFMVQLESLPRRSNAPGGGLCSPMESLRNGEDYELLFAIDPQVASEATRVLLELECPVTQIGVVKAADPGAAGLTVVTGDGETIDCDDLGWEHGA